MTFDAGFLMSLGKLSPGLAEKYVPSSLLRITPRIFDWKSLVPEAVVIAPNSTATSAYVVSLNVFPLFEINPNDSSYTSSRFKGLIDDKNCEKSTSYTAWSLLPDERLSFDDIWRLYVLLRGTNTDSGTLNCYIVSWRKAICKALHI